MRKHNFLFDKIWRKEKNVVILASKNNDMERLKTKEATNYKTVSYNEISEQIKMLPNEKIKKQNLRAAIKEGEESGFHNDFDPDAFLQKIKSERHNG